MLRQTIPTPPGPVEGLALRKTAEDPKKLMVLFLGGGLLWGHILILK